MGHLIQANQNFVAFIIDPRMEISWLHLTHPDEEQWWVQGLALGYLLAVVHAGLDLATLQFWIQVPTD